MKLVSKTLAKLAGIAAFAAMGLSSGNAFAQAACWWMDSAPPYNWIKNGGMRANSEAECKRLDSCSPGGGRASGGGCYVWSVDPNGVEKEVRYGAKKLEAKKVSTTVEVGCDNGTFGKDPVPGVKKTCFINGQKVTEEGGKYKATVATTADVEYGAEGWATKKLKGKQTCNNQTFGDPLVGVVKACYIDGKKVADENGQFEVK